MRRRGEIIGSVDFGSREVRVLIARKDEDGTIRIAGLGTAPAQGCVSQGVIQDLNAAQVALKHAITDAEKEARMHIGSLFCGINGRNVETFIREGNVKLDREVVEQTHMDEALDIASRDVLGAGKRIVSSITAQEWYVDEMRVTDPTGIRGHVLKTRVHFARIPSVIEDNIVHCIESQRRELEDIIFLPLASSLGCLTPEDTELGVGLLDMGRSTTGLAVHRDRRILSTCCFEWGGYHLTRDVAAGLHVSFEEADELILEYGVSDDFIAAEGRDRIAAEGRCSEGLEEPVQLPKKNNIQIKLKTAVPGVPAIVARDELDLIVFERARELMTKVRQYLHSRGLVKHLIRGMVLTGGAAGVKNYAALAEAIFQVPCRVGVPHSIENMPQVLKSPEFSGVVGIARHGFNYRSAHRNGRFNSRGPLAAGARNLSRAVRKYFF